MALGRQRFCPIPPDDFPPRRPDWFLKAPRWKLYKAMEFDQFIHQVRERARLRSSQAATNATFAALSSLTERLCPNQLARLVAAVPGVFGRVLTAPVSRPPKAGFDSFCQELADREQTDVPVAVFHARCVIDALRAVLGPAEIDALASALTRDFAPLFRALTPQARAA